ncbi:MAG: sigma-70 family RNA polymerase sigma factor [Burkholderiales bacterium]|nr:sigma-70 family RNA polymerase sigma factor [Burkholderiales bacterium]
MKQVESTLHALMSLAQAGDNAAYRQFLGQSGARLRAYFRRRLVAYPDDVEDLVQETLLAIHNSRQTYRSAQPVTAWLHAIARYKLVDCLRARSARAAIDVPLDDDIEASFADEAPLAAESRRDLLAMLATLPDRFRLPIVHVKLEGLSVAEAATRTGMSESAVKVGIHRGLKRLALQARGDS